MGVVEQVTNLPHNSWKRKELTIMQSITTFLLVIIVALALAPAPQSQRRSSPGEKPEEKTGCGTVVTPEELKAELTRRAELARKNAAPQAITPPTDNPYYLPLTIHIVHDETGILGGLLPGILETAIENLNRMFQPVGVQFFIYGEIDHSIRDINLYDALTREKQNTLLGVNSVPNTINVYVANLGKLCGRGTLTSDSAPQGVLLSDLCLENISDSGKGNLLSLFAHEVGHYLNLYHTHEKALGVECPNGSNCKDAGDLLCDTPADPDLSSPSKVDLNCVYNNSVAPPAAKCGGDATPYAPLTNNLMSESRGACKNQFTAEQINKMLQTLLNDGKRKKLIDSWKFYVDPQASSSNTKCTSNAPCRTVEKAVQAARDGAVIYLKPGVHPVSSVGGKKLTLLRWGGSGVAELRP